MINIIKKQSDINIELPFFCTEKYLLSKSDNYGWFCSDNFILQFIIYKNFLFKRMVFTNEVISKKDTSSEDEQLFLEQLIEYIKNNKICDYIYKPNPNAVFRTYPKNSDSFT